MWVKQECDRNSWNVETKCTKREGSWLKKDAEVNFAEKGEKRTVKSGVCTMKGTFA